MKLSYTSAGVVVTCNIFLARPMGNRLVLLIFLASFLFIHIDKLNTEQNSLRLVRH